MTNPASRTHRNVIGFLIIVAFFQIMGGLMGWITSESVDGWYQTIHKSPLNPPDAVFGIVWSMLYVVLSIAFWLVWKKEESNHRTTTLSLFMGHMVLNWLWTPVFFTLHLLFISYALVLILIFTAAMVAWLAFQEDKRTAIAFAPYILWLCFAGHLSQYIWIAN